MFPAQPVIPLQERQNEAIKPYVRWVFLEEVKITWFIGETWLYYIVLGSKIIADADCMRLKDTCSLKENLWQA